LRFDFRGVELYLHSPSWLAQEQLCWVLALE
jgi:hypothetical protein